LEFNVQMLILSFIANRVSSLQLYILLSDLLDPDAISRSVPILRSALHWYVGNIPGDEIKEGTTMTAHAGPGPPRFTGLHRYVFVVYEQLNGKIEYPKSYFFIRPRFSVKNAIQKFNLSPQPLAGNFFQAKHS